MMIKHVLTGINMVLLTVVVYSAVNLFYTVTGGMLEDGMPVTVSRSETGTVAAVTGQKRLADYSAISRRNIFNAERESEVGAAPPAIDLESLRRTELDLRLLGTISGLGNNSYAVIEQTRRRRQDLYQVGDSVEGATIKLIVRKKVVLTINGNDEVLEIAEESLAKQQTGRDARRPRAVGQRRLPGTDRSTQQVNLDRQEVQEAFSNINDLMRSVRVRPNFSEDGQPDGILLDGIAPESFFSRMGLESQDIILGVNGNRISTVDDAMGVYQNLSTSSSVMLQVKRGEETRMIQYTIR